MTTGRINQGASYARAFASDSLSLSSGVGRSTRERESSSLLVPLMPPVSRAGRRHSVLISLSLTAAQSRERETACGAPKSVATWCFTRPRSSFFFSFSHVIDGIVTVSRP